MVFALGFAAEAGETPTAPPEIGPADGRDPVVAARGALEDLRFDDAMHLVQPLLASPDARRRLEALEITAVAHLVLGHPEEGRRAVAALYEIAPGFVLTDPSLPPRVTAVFAAEAARPHRRGVTPSVRPRTAAEFDLVVGGAPRVELTCRSTTRGSFAPIATRLINGNHRFHLPSSGVHRCYAVALDEAGLPLGRLGSAKDPVELRPAATASPALTARWWFWAGLGAVAVATAVVVIVATQPEQANPPPADITVSAKSVRW
jgi:hypothetical protein